MKTSRSKRKILKMQTLPTNKRTLYMCIDKINIFALNCVLNIFLIFFYFNEKPHKRKRIKFFG